MRQHALPTAPRDLFGHGEWGPELLSIRARRQERDRLVAVVTDLLRAGGGAIILAFASEERRSALSVLQMAVGPLRRRIGFRGNLSETDEDIRSELSVFSDSAGLFLEPPYIDERTGVLIFHDAPRYPLLREWAAFGIPDGCVVIATGNVDEWETIGESGGGWVDLFATRTVWHRVRPTEFSEGWRKVAARRLDRVQEIGKEIGSVCNVYGLVTLLESVGVPSPVPLIAAVEQTDELTIEDLLESHPDLFHRVLRWRPGPAFYTTGSGLISTFVVEEMYPSASILAATVGHVLKGGADRASAAEVRTSILRLLWGLAQRGKRDVVRSLLRDPAFQVFVRSYQGAMLDRAHSRERRQAGSYELHTWIKLLQEVSQFPDAARLLDDWTAPGEADPIGRVYLGHARGALYRRWAESAPTLDIRRDKAYQGKVVLNEVLNALAQWSDGGRKNRAISYTYHEIALCDRLLGVDPAVAFGRAAHAAELSSGTRDGVKVLVSWADALMEAGRIREALDKLNEAEEILKDGHATLPDYDSRVLYVLHVRGRLALRQMPFPSAAEPQFKDAAEAFRAATESFLKVLQKDGHNLPALVELGRSAWIRGHLFAAVYWFEKAVRIDPGNVIALLNLGLVYDRWGDLDQADLYFRRVLEQEPFSIRACTARAAAALRHQRRDLAEAALRQAVAIEFGESRPFAESENPYVLALAAQMEPSEAHRFLARAIDRISVNQAFGREPALLTLIASSKSARDRRDAERLFRDAEGEALRRRSYEDYLVTRNAWAEYYVNVCGDATSARGITEQTVAFDPANALTRIVLADVLTLENRMEDAAAERARALELQNYLGPDGEAGK